MQRTRSSAASRVQGTIYALGLLTAILLYLPIPVSAAPLAIPPMQTANATTQMVTRAALPSFTAVVAGDEHSCGLTKTGGVFCWGNHTDGQVGDGTPFAYRPPVAVNGLANGVQALAANGSHTCALLQTGSVQCWGRNSNGQLGDGSTTERRVPVPIVGLTGAITALTAGNGHTCALLQTGGVQCWGRNSNGQLGNGSTGDQSTPVTVNGLSGVVTALAAGANHTCALLQTGGIQCWGDNSNGQLGDGTLTNQPLPTAVAGLLSTATGVTAGSDHTCAILADGRVQCWGDNARGQLGDGTREDRTTPVLVNSLSDKAASVVAGHFHTCILAIDGDLHCWGSNSRGQLGTGTLESSRLPQRVTGTPGDAVAIAAGLDHTCALFRANTVYCWGSNRSRQLGQGAPGVASVPHLLFPAPLADGAQPINGIPAIAGGRYHTCLLTPSRGVQCWGRNSDGQVGDGSQAPRSAPFNVPGLASGGAALALGAEHSCALLQSGAVHCWGSNQAGQLGDGTTTQQLTPTAVIGLTGPAVALTAGDSHTCVLLQTGGVACWGANQAGQLGDGTTAPASSPVIVAGLASGVVAIAAGAEHSCALLQTGGVQCWGANQAGQLGDGTQINHATPVDVTGLATVMTLAAGGAHTCALRSDGSVSCWGANSNGQLGDGTRMGQVQPVAVTGLPGPATAITAGYAHTCALLATTQARCWGSNETSQLGDGTTIARLAPVAVSGLAANVLSLKAGGYHTCVLVTGNRPLCWGRDSDGQLGSGAFTQSPTLVGLAEAPPAQLTLNYVTAQPGSTLTLIGSGLPYSTTMPLLVNGTTVSDTLSINPSGELIVSLTTQDADPGAYLLQVGNPPSATAFFMLQPLAALRPTEGGGSTLAIPAGVAQPLTELYMPVVGR